MTTLLHSQATETEIVVAGAGIIGLSLALELHSRGHRVMVIDTQPAMRAASIAAAGMLAADDPHNPAALHELACYSLSLYPAYLARIAELSQHTVPFQTDTVIQHHANGTQSSFPEHSLDPRGLADALLRAVRQRSRYASPTIQLLENTGPYDLVTSAAGIELHFDSGSILHAKTLVHAQGAWFGTAVTPRKGQMLRVQLPPSLRHLNEVHRREDVYIVPRTIGPQAGTALIGATVEDAGFDIGTHPADLAALRARAAELLPALADEHAAPLLESWAGLRPSTADGLPLIGALTPHQFVAAGHFRNGILLAPATAVVIADLINGKPRPVDLRAFDPGRFRSL